MPRKKLKWPRWYVRVEMSAARDWIYRRSVVGSFGFSSDNKKDMENLFEKLRLESDNMKEKHSLEDRN